MADISKEINDGLLPIWNSLQHIGPALPEIGEILLGSVQANFQAGGRFGSGAYGGGTQHWLPSEHSGGKTLVDTGNLLKSLAYQVQGEELTISTDVAYAAIHQYGGTIQRDGYGITIPARPYINIQDEDLIDIRDALIGYYSALL